MPLRYAGPTWKRHLGHTHPVAANSMGKPRDSPDGTSCALAPPERRQSAGSVALITSRPWANCRGPGVGRQHPPRGVETGLRIGASRHDDTCSLHRHKAMPIQGMFNRRAKSLFMHWHPRPSHHHRLHRAMAENHDPARRLRRPPPPLVNNALATAAARRNCLTSETYRRP